MASPVETLVRSVVGKGIEVLAEHNRKHLPKPTTPHPFLDGVHRPMTQELTLEDLAVSGSIPPALDGRYLRIGPNPIDPDPASYHWFIGDGMVHGLKLQDGRALWYRNRWIRSNAVAAALHVEPAPGPRHVFDTVNTNVVDIAGRTFALVEAGSYPVVLSDDLTEQAYDPFGGGLKGSFTAHPHRDSLTGEMHAICYEARDPDVIRHVAMDAGGRVLRETPIPVQHGPMIHDCGLTARYVVILDLPVTLSMKTLIAGHGLSYRWNPAHRARVGLLARDGTAADVIWCEMDPAYAFHVANAFDMEDGRVAIDVCAYATMFDGHGKGPDATPRGLERWIADPVSRRVEVQTLQAGPHEFPRCDERRFGQPYRYVYALTFRDGGDEPFRAEGVCRQDVLTGARQVHRFGEGRYPGEFVFIPRAADSAEGEGWLMGLVVDAGADTTELVILDAQDLDAAPVAVVHLPHRVPPGFHGNWIGRGLTFAQKA